MKFLLFSFALTLFIACNTADEKPASEVSLDGYQTIALDGGGQKVLKVDGADVPIEDGFIVNGQRQGMWRTFFDDGKIKTLTHYINGLKNGPYYEFTNRGQIELVAEFLNDKQHGRYAKYKFGRPTVETDYVDGVVHGVHREYFQNKDNIQKEVHFKEGKQHGKLTYYDEEGNITLQYDYENGEKTGGGIIENE